MADSLYLQESWSVHLDLQNLQIVQSSHYVVPLYIIFEMQPS